MRELKELQGSFVESSIWTVFYAVIHLKVKMLLIVDIKMYALVRG